MAVGMAVRSHRRQLNAQMFIEFSARFQDVIRGMPSCVWRKPDGEPPPPPSEELTKCSMRAFHVLADLYHLHKGGYISPDLWKPWHQGIRRTLQNPILQREWIAVEEAFAHVPDYCRYIHRVIEEGRTSRHHSHHHFLRSFMVTSPENISNGL